MNRRLVVLGPAFLALNLAPRRDAAVSFPDLGGRSFERYSVTATDPLGRAVLLKGVALALASDGALPETPGVAQRAAV